MKMKPNYPPEGCKLVAIHDGAGRSATWLLCVEDPEGETVAYIRWPRSWPSWVKADFLMEKGFECRTA